MLYSVKINESITKSNFGYVSSDLPKGSHKVVIVECEHCHTLTRREYRNAQKNHSCPIVVGNKKRCFACKEWKDLSLFNKSYKESGHVSKLCKECYNKHEAVLKWNKSKIERLKQSFKEDINYYFNRRCSSIRSHCKQNNIPFNLDVNFLIELRKKQSGKCYYTNLDLKSEGRINCFQSWSAPSLDRKIPELGYIKENVVWCAFGVNSFKQSLTEEQFKEKVKLIKWWF